MKLKRGFIKQKRVNYIKRFLACSLRFCKASWFMSAEEIKDDNIVQFTTRILKRRTTFVALYYSNKAKKRVCFFAKGKCYHTFCQGKCRCTMRCADEPDFVNSACRESLLFKVCFIFLFHLSYHFKYLVHVLSSNVYTCRICSFAYYSN